MASIYFQLCFSEYLFDSSLNGIICFPLKMIGRLLHYYEIVKLLLLWYSFDLSTCTCLIYFDIFDWHSSKVDNKHRYYLTPSNINRELWNISWSKTLYLITNAVQYAILRRLKRAFALAPTELCTLYKAGQQCNPLVKV